MATFDAIVIGASEAGVEVGNRAVKAGKRVADLWSGVRAHSRTAALSVHRVTSSGVTLLVQMLQISSTLPFS